MKTNKLILVLTFAVALSFGATGCKHKHYVTKLNEGAPSGEPGNPLPPGPGMNDANGGVVGNGGGPTADATDFEGMTQDRAALASYTVHFAFDSAAVKKSEMGNVQSVASALQSDASAKLLIEGHCDERGTEEYNRSLGERRALALREAVAKDGIDPNRIRTISYGEDRPVDPGHDETAWSKNRRGEFVLLHPK